MVTINVGSPSTRHVFLVHKNTICNKSPFFAAAFGNDNFIEGKTQTLLLDDVEAEVFGLVSEFIYTSEINDLYGTPLIFLAKVWALAERFLMPALQNTAMICLVIRMLKHYDEKDDPIQLIEYVYEIDRALEPGPLKKLVLGFWHPTIPSLSTAALILSWRNFRKRF